MPICPRTWTNVSECEYYPKDLGLLVPNTNVCPFVQECLRLFGPVIQTGIPAAADLNERHAARALLLPYQEYGN